MSELTNKNTFLEKQNSDLQNDSIPACTEELNEKKEQLRDSEEQHKKIESGEQASGNEFVQNMQKAC
jgi:hypothetical protein